MKYCVSLIILKVNDNFRCSDFESFLISIHREFNNKSVNHQVHRALQISLSQLTSRRPPRLSLHPSSLSFPFVPSSITATFSYFPFLFPFKTKKHFLQWSHTVAAAPFCQRDLSYIVFHQWGRLTRGLRGRGRVEGKGEKSSLLPRGWKKPQFPFRLNERETGAAESMSRSKCI